MRPHLDPLGPVARLVVDVDVPEQLVPVIADVCHVSRVMRHGCHAPDVHAGAPEVAEPRAEGLHVAEAPGAELQRDVALLPDCGQRRGHRLVALLLRRRLGTTTQFSKDPYKPGTDAVL